MSWGTWKSLDSTYSNILKAMNPTLWGLTAFRWCESKPKCTERKRNTDLLFVRFIDQWKLSYTSWLPSDSLISDDLIKPSVGSMSNHTLIHTQICIFTASYTTSVISSQPHKAKAKGLMENLQRCANQMIAWTFWINAIRLCQLHQKNKCIIH